MVETKEKVTVLYASAATDNEQSQSQNFKDSISGKLPETNYDFDGEVLQDYFLLLVPEMRDGIF